MFQYINLHTCVAVTLHQTVDAVLQPTELILERGYVDFGHSQASWSLCYAKLSICWLQLHTYRTDMRMVLISWQRKQTSTFPKMLHLYLNTYHWFFICLFKLMSFSFFVIIQHPGSAGSESIAAPQKSKLGSVIILLEQIQ